MKSKVLILLFLLFSAISMRGQEGKINDILNSNRPRKFSADFIQIKQSALLEKELVSTGRITLEKSGQIHIETITPEQKVTDYNSDDTGKNYGFRLPSEKDFDITLLEGDGYILKMIPKRGNLRQIISQIIVHTDSQTQIANKLMILFRNGDLIQLEFSDIKVTI